MFKTALIALISLLSLGYANDRCYKPEEIKTLKAPSEAKFGERFAQKFDKWSNDNTPLKTRCDGGFVLDLRRKKLNDFDVIDFVNEVRAGQFAYLYELEIRSNKIGDRGAEALAYALLQGYLPNLKELVLFDNQIGHRGMATLELVQECRPELSIFGLNLHLRDEL